MSRLVRRFFYQLAAFENDACRVLFSAVVAPSLPGKRRFGGPSDGVLWRGDDIALFSHTVAIENGGFAVGGSPPFSREVFAIESDVFRTGLARSALAALFAPSGGVPISLSSLIWSLPPLSHNRH